MHIEKVMIVKNSYLPHEIKIIPKQKYKEDYMGLIQIIYPQSFQFFSKTKY